jgi:hypothetical protein
MKEVEVFGSVTAVVEEPRSERSGFSGREAFAASDPEVVAVARRRAAFYANRRRSRSLRGRSLQKKRAEYPERGFAHLKRTGGLARVFVRGKQEVTKKLQSYVAAANLGMILHTLIGIGTPRSLQGRLPEALATLFALLGSLIVPFRRIRHPKIQFVAWKAVKVAIRRIQVSLSLRTLNPAFATGC